VRVLGRSVRGRCQGGCPGHATYQLPIQVRDGASAKSFGRPPGPPLLEYLTERSRSLRADSYAPRIGELAPRARGAAVPVQEAALNNAEWCHAFCRTHGIAARFDTAAWSSVERTPPFYPDDVSLVSGCSAERLVSRVDASPGCSIKDSIADLDLSPSGFEVLFTAEWLCRDRASVAVSRRAGWRSRASRSWGDGKPLGVSRRSRAHSSAANC
jgi:hypothetical protein